jgi:adenosylmethionine-8-amino-7-oxononanoate aminotransferase
VWHPYSRFSTLTNEDLPCIVGGEGIHLIASDGRRYVDAISSWWCCQLGHGHPDIVAAIRDQAGKLQHSILGNLTHEPAIALADRLAGLMPAPDRHVLFASDGSSAVEQAIKIAIQYRANIGQTKRHALACLEGGYHGDTLGAMALGYLDQFHRPYQRHLLPVLRLPFPSCPCALHAVTCREPCFAPARKMLDAQAESLTAVIVEPLLQGAAGMRLYGVSWLRELADWCRTHDVLLIVDEIATGFGRTGPWFAFQHAGIDPDIVCVGKGLAAGYLPISATIVRDNIYATFADQPADHTLQHGHTFCGNPIAAAAALAALKVYESGIIDAVPGKGKRLADALAPLHAHPLVREVRSFGLMTAVELHAEPAASGGISRPHRIRRRLRDLGILLRPLGPVLYVMPPLITPENDLKDLGAAIIRAMED